MNNFKKTIIILLSLFCYNANATIKTLNNNNPSPGQYSSWSAIQSNLFLGDTVYVSGSGTNYGNINTNTTITIIGTGFNPQKQNPLVAQFGSITSSSHLTLIGIEFSNFNQNTLAGFINLKVDKCKFISLHGNGGFGINIYCANSIITGGLYFNSGDDANTPLDFSRLTFKNNLMYGAIGGNYPYGALELSSITNNIFISSSATVYLNNTINTSEIKNNIFIGMDWHAPYYNTDNTFQYNCAYPLTQTVPANTGTTNLVADPLFVDYPCLVNPCAFLPSQDFHLQTISPCKTLGLLGSETGLYNTNSDFTMSGEPHIPQIKEMNMPTVIYSGQSFNINIATSTK